MPGRAWAATHPRFPSTSGQWEAVGHREMVTRVSLRQGPM